jgi:hypothetical protein
MSARRSDVHDTGLQLVVVHGYPYPQGGRFAQALRQRAGVPGIQVLQGDDRAAGNCAGSGASTRSSASAPPRLQTRARTGNPLEVLAAELIGLVKQHGFWIR